MSTRPPYRVPLVAETRAAPRNGRSIISTFSGCGGSCYGFRLAGYDVLYAAEFVPAARESYAANYPETKIDGRDIREITAEEILAEVGRERGDVDVLEGSPPCASFSTAGKRSAHWGDVKSYSDTEQRTDDLFFEFARLVEGIQPRTFVAENVSGLVKGVAKGYFLEILARLKACGYEVEAKLLDAQWLGVPQARQRIIFMGVRRDLVERYDVHPSFPAPLPYRYSVRDALPGLMRQGDNGGFGKGSFRPTTSPSPTIGASPTSGNGKFPPSVIEVARVIHDTSGNRSIGDITDRPAPTVTVGVNSVNSRHFQIEASSVSQRINQRDTVEDCVGASMDGYSLGREWDKLSPGQTSDKYLNLSRPHPDRPCPTVTAQGAASGMGAPGGIASVTHPTERRKFTIAELRRICGFPDDFALTGTYAQRWERLGRAVPPPMMAAVAQALLTGVLDKLPPSRA